MSTLPDLGRRLSRKIETGKGIQLSPGDLDLLVETGAYGLILNAIADYQRNQCQHRSARNRSINGEISGSTRAKAGTSKSSGMTNSEGASEALAQVQRMLKRVS